MTWTTTKPTKAGWYWMLEAHREEPEMVLVNGPVDAPTADLPLYVVGCGWTDDQFLVNGFADDTKWHGPVDEPQFMESGKVWWTDRAVDHNT